MKKIFLIFALTTLMNIGVNAEVNNADIAIFRDREWTQGIEAEENKIDIQQQEGYASTVAPQSNLADSFMAAFGMEVDAGGSGDAGPGKSKASISRGKMGAGMSNISSCVINQVAPPFMPYSYQK